MKWKQRKIKGTPYTEWPWTFWVVSCFLQLPAKPNPGKKVFKLKRNSGYWSVYWHLCPFRFYVQEQEGICLKVACIKQLALDICSEIIAILFPQFLFLLENKTGVKNDGKRAATVIGCDVNKPFWSSLHYKKKEE